MFGMFPELTDIMESDTDETSCIESITYLGPIYYILLRSQKKNISRYVLTEKLFVLLVCNHNNSSRLLFS